MFEPDPGTVYADRVTLRSRVAAWWQALPRWAALLVVAVPVLVVAFAAGLRGASLPLAVVVAVGAADVVVMAYRKRP